MGGRSRDEQGKPGAFAFVSELSDARLEAYGRATSSGFQNFSYRSITETGKPSTPDVFNEHLSREYARRTGSTPDWDLSINGGHDNHIKTRDSFLPNGNKK